MEELRENQVYSFDPPDFFSDAYTFQEVISIPKRARGTRRILVFKAVRNDDGYEVAVRCMPSTLREGDQELAEQQLATLKEIQKMRKQLKLQCIVKLHGYCKINSDPFATYAPQESDLPPLLPGTFYWNVIMDYIPKGYKTLSQKKMNWDMIIVFLVDLLYTIWQARRHFQFYHGDIHQENIMFLSLGEWEQTRTYNIEGMQFKVKAPYLPVLVDFELSRFGGNKREFHSDVQDIVSALDYIAVKEHKLKALRSYDRLREQVVGIRGFPAFEDSRFTPEKIVQILHTHPLFENLRTPIQGGEEPPLTKYKKNM